MEMVIIKYVNQKKQKFTIEIYNENRTLLERIWIVLTNPFLYIIKGKIRY